MDTMASLLFTVDSWVSRIVLVYCFLLLKLLGNGSGYLLVLMLEYCLLDLRRPVRPDCLYGLSLLPLADGASAKFNHLGVDERIYIAKGEGVWFTQGFDSQSAG
ncbi:hypothetical protein Droror1_Dr00025744 [Drosera rotundifolia]